MERLFEIYQPQELVQTSRFINTPSDFARKALFYVQETGYLKSLKSHLSRRHSLASYLFLIVLSGSGTFTYREHTYVLKAFDCVLADCLELYTHRSDDAAPWELLWVHFYGCCAGEYYDYFLQNNNPVFHPEDAQEFISLVRQLMEVHKNKELFWELEASKLITQLLTACVCSARKPAHPNEDSVNKKLHGIRDYLDQHFQEKILLDQLAASFYISKFYLSREFKRVFGMTVSGYLMMKRINYAKELLRFTDRSIEKIAADCGYPDACYFNKVFQKAEAMTGSEYRRRWKGRNFIFQA